MPYSVSPRRKLMIVGLNPSWNFNTLMPTRLAARKWPSSCTNTSTPSTNANDRSVSTSETSDLQFYAPGDFLRILTRPAIDGMHLGQRRHFGRLMGLHRALDDVRDRGEAEPALQESLHGDLVRGVEHDGQAPRGHQGPIREPQAGKRVRVWHAELEPPRPGEIERRQPRAPALGVRKGVLDRQP